MKRKRYDACVDTLNKRHTKTRAATDRRLRGYHVFEFFFEDHWKCGCGYLKRRVYEKTKLWRSGPFRLTEIMEYHAPGGGVTRIVDSWYDLTIEGMLSPCTVKSWVL